MFKRKKVEVPKEVPKEEPEKPTEVIETDVETKKAEEPKEKVELTPEQQKMVKMIEEFRKKYGGIFSYEDFAVIRIEPTLCNLLLAIYMEMKGLREDIAEVNKE